MKFKKIIIVATSCIGLMCSSGFGKKKQKDSVEKEIIYNKSAKKHKITSNSKNTQKESTITVWIHGTRLFPDFTFRNFFYTPPNFTHIDNIDQKYHIRKIANRLIKHDPDRFSKEHFYIFGWSGKACFTARKEAAKTLYDHLEKLAYEHIKQYNHKPLIRVITHSHGGNVALNLPAVKKSDPPFTIKELVLLACPVQEATKKYISDPLFERCYSLSSRADFLQVIDPQGLYKDQGGLINNPLFSQRIFPADHKLTQARIKINGRYILHVEFLLRRFINNLPCILDKLDKHYEQSHQDEPTNLTETILVLNLRKQKTAQTG